MNKSTTAPVGSVRPSQLLWTYGPGALVDLPNLSVITMGLSHWKEELCEEVHEGRLLSAVRGSLGNQVKSLRKPPVMNDSDEPLSAAAHLGVPVSPFPRWLRCVRCGLLAEYDSGLFDIKEDLYRPERTCFVHTNCDRGKKAEAVPARFLVACRNGHLDDFPWHWYVHNGPSSCKGTIRFFEKGASLQTENLWVKCDECNVPARSLAHAFGSEGRENLPACRGRHPHLDRYEPNCEERPRAVVLGATNAWFPVTLSALAIPLEDDKIEQFVTDAWTDLEDLEDEGELRGALKSLKKRGGFPELESLAPTDIWAVVGLRKRKPTTETEPILITDEEMKYPEWKVLTSPNPNSDWPHFLCEKTEVPISHKGFLERVVLVPRLRQVNALLGFTRVESPEEVFDSGDSTQIARLSAVAPSWIPASEVHGEGIFLRFDEEVLTTWENRNGVQRRDERLLRGHRGWRTSRKLVGDAHYPGVRYAMLHTLSHLLIREFSLECGYSSASIRERIYATEDPSRPMAGILLYTAAADADGTLGGLVELGKPENLGRILEQALRRAKICSSDPLCSEHEPGEDRSLHNAACHACSFVAETSCERGNRYLDRALLVPTLECSDAGFFEP